MTQHYFERPTPQLLPLPGIGVAVSVPVADVGEYLHRHHLRVVKCYWTARGECVVTVTPRAAGTISAEMSSEGTDVK